MKIRNKLLLSILTVVITVLAVLGWMSYTYSRNALTKEIKARAKTTINAYSWQLNSEIAVLESMARGLANAVETFLPYSEEEVQTLIKNSLQMNPQAYGSAIAFEPGSFIINKHLVSPYFHRSPDGLKFVELGTTSYNYPEWDWYSTPRASGKPHWGQPYIDEGGGEVAMITYSYPFYRKNKFWGIATVDITLDSLTDEIEKIKIGDSGYGFLLDKNGALLTKRSEEWYFGKTIFDLAKESNNPGLSSLGSKMTSGESGSVSILDTRTNKMLYVVYNPIPSTNWSFGIVFPQTELMSVLYALHKNMILIAVIGLVVIFVLILIISNRISKPISNLADCTKLIAGGDFTIKPVVSKSKDEIGTLTRAFSDMEVSLISSLNKLKEEKEMFQTCFSEMTDGLIIMNSKLNIIQFNETAKRLLMLPAKNSIVEHIESNYRSSVPFEKLFDLKHPSLIAFELNRTESENFGPLILAAILTPIYDENKNLRLIVLTFRDTTTETMQETSKRSFLSLVSHKLRTPVTAIQMIISLFKDGLLGDFTEKQSRQIDTLSQQTLKLQRIIEQLINFVNIEKADYDNSRDKIDLNKFFTELSTDAKQWFPNKEPQINVDISTDAQTLSFNQKYFKLVFGQLIDNGLKFNLSIPSIINVKTSRENENTIISITDNGIGIPPEHINKIFDKFYQIDKYFTGNVEGAGLGLAYVRHIMDHFKCSIDIQSKPGKGSTFTVILPNAR